MERASSAHFVIAWHDIGSPVCHGGPQWKEGVEMTSLLGGPGQQKKET